MFNFLKGGKASVDLTLDREHYRPGETIRARAVVASEKDLNIRQGRVVLVYHEEHEYRYEERSRDSDGHWRTEQKRSRQSWDQEVARVEILPEGTVRGGPPQSFECALTIPPDAPSSGQGKIIRVRWEVKATLDRKLAGDIEDRVDVRVFNTLPGQSHAGRYGYSDEPAEAMLALDLSGLEWALGETIEGRLLVQPQKAFGVSEVRVELVCLERVPSGQGSAPRLGGVSLGIGVSGRRVLQNESERVEKVQVAGKTMLEPGQELAFPFRLTVPPASLASGQYRDGSVHWLLKGVLARSLRSDTHVEQEILVAGGRA